MLICHLLHVSVSIYIGLDFGSYYTKASIVTSSEHPEIATNYETKRLTPTFIAFRTPAGFDWSDKEITVAEAEILRPEFGERALEVMASRPLSGTGFLPAFTDLDDETSNQLARKLGVSVLAARVMKKDATCVFLRQFLQSIAKGRKIQGVHMVVPAHFTLPQRAVLNDMLRSVGVVRSMIIDDVTAVCCAYGIARSDRFKSAPRSVLFLDVGATSIQAYILRFEQLPDGTGVRRLAYAYDVNSGGSFVTANMVDDIIERYSLGPVTDATRRNLFDAAEKLKKQLTLTGDAKIQVETCPKTIEIVYTRERLESDAHDLLNALSRVVDSVLTVGYDEVEIIGGSSRLPFLATFLSQKYGMKVNRSFNADEMLAIGAGYYGQFGRDISRYKTVSIGDFASIYDIWLETRDGKLKVCNKGHQCVAMAHGLHDTPIVSVKYNASQLRKGLQTSQFDYQCDIPGDFDLLLLDGPFDIYEARQCYGADSASCKTTPLLEMRPVFTASPVLKAILRGEKERLRIATAHNKLEQYINMVSDEIDNNETVHAFSNPEQRAAVKIQLETARRWLFENASSATHAQNFSDITEQVRRLMAPIYDRIKVNSTIRDVATLYVDTLDYVTWSLRHDWPSRNIHPPDDFLELYNFTIQWYNNATRILSATEPWQDLPFTPKQMRKHGKNLFDAYLKINKTGNSTPDPTATPSKTDQEL